MKKAKPKVKSTFHSIELASAAFAFRFNKTVELYGGLLSKVIFYFVFAIIMSDLFPNIKIEFFGTDPNELHYGQTIFQIVVVLASSITMGLISLIKESN